MINKWIKVNAYLVTVFVLLSGCTSSSPGESSQENQPAEGQVSDAGVFPITEKPATLKVMVKANPLVEDFAANRFSKWLEEKTNIKVEWEVVPEKSAQDKLNLVLASGDYPDVIMGFGVSPAQQLIYGSQGVFLPLNKYIDQYGVETKKMFQENDYIKGLISAPDGNIYSLPQVNQCYHCSVPNKMWIYKPWLDKLGLKLPTTTDELYEVLKAFKEKDPNGNGKADEIPLAGSIIGGSQIDLFLMNAFIYNNSNHLLLQNGKIDVAFNKPEWKEGLQYLHKLYTNKLLDPQTFSQDDKQLKQLGENPDVPILGVAPAQNMGVFTQFFGSSGRWLEYVAVPPLKGPKGVQLASSDPWGISGGTFVITNKAKNPAAAFRWADAMYNREMTLNSVFGRMDQEWRWAEKTELGIDNKPAIWKRLASFGQVQNIHWAQTGPSYRSNTLRLGEAMDPEKPNQEILLYNETKSKYEPYRQKQEQVVPPLFFNSDQSAEIADLQKIIGDYVMEMIARFVTGDADLTKDWDAYLKTLDGMNVKRYIQLYQEAYDSRSLKK